MWTTLDNRKKATSYSPRSVFKKKNKVEERRASSSRVKKQHENTHFRAQKMMSNRVQPSIILILTKVVPLVVQIVR
jgi:hypothetical protein